MPRFSQLIIIGWFVNSIAVLRMGDPYRAYALSREAKVGMAPSLGTILAERVTDMFAILALLLVGVAGYSASGDASVVVRVLAAALLMTAALVVLLFVMKRFGVRLAGRLPSAIARRYRAFHDVALGSLRQLPALLTLGICGWLLEAARLYFVVQALDMSISLPLILIVSLGHAILSAVPTPGGVGAVEPGVTALPRAWTRTQRRTVRHAGGQDDHLPKHPYFWRSDVSPLAVLHNTPKSKTRRVISS